jgi:tRNA (guanine-N7-)-methyltransferase
MRKKPNLIPRMERCAAVLTQEPEALRGKWLSRFPGLGALYLELGCGKGRFTCETASIEKTALLAAVERVPDALVIALERAVAAELPNARFMSLDAARLADVFAPGEVNRIYINFCDPWPSNKRAKRRLTSEGFLRLYTELLAPGGEIHFKTDNAPLFEYSLERFALCGFSLSEVTRDLHGGGVTGIMTDYEVKFAEQGVPIRRCVAARK